MGLLCTKLSSLPSLPLFCATMATNGSRSLVSRVTDTVVGRHVMRSGGKVGSVARLLWLWASSLAEFVGRMVFLLPVMFGLGAISGLALVGTLGGGQYTGMEFHQLLQKIHHIAIDQSWRILHFALGSGLLTGLLVGVPVGFIFAPIVGLFAGAPVGLAVGLCTGTGAALRQVARSMTHRQSRVVPRSFER
jgi:hypothetical protein